MEIAFEIHIGEVGDRIGTRMGKAFGKHHQADTFTAFKASPVALSSDSQDARQTRPFRKAPQVRHFLSSKIVSPDLDKIDLPTVEVENSEIFFNASTGQAEAYPRIAAHLEICPENGDFDHL
jgi:hypothetical protein